MYSNESSTASVAEVSTVVRMRSSNSSRMMAATSIGEARRKIPLPRNSTKYTKPGSPARMRKRRSSRIWPALRASARMTSGSSSGSSPALARASLAPSRARVDSTTSSAPVRDAAASAASDSVARCRPDALFGPAAGQSVGPMRERDLREAVARMIAQPVDRLRDLVLVAAIERACRPRRARRRGRNPRCGRC